MCVILWGILLLHASQNYGVAPLSLYTCPAAKVVVFCDRVNQVDGYVAGGRLSLATRKRFVVGRHAPTRERHTMPKGSRGTGRKVKGGGKSRTNQDHLRAARRGIVKTRWDDICAAELKGGTIIQGRAQEDVVAEKTALDPDKPGLGQWYCVACARYCINQKALDDHQRTSKHKRRLKTLLTETPYSHAEATAAAGKGATDHGLSMGLGATAMAD